MRVETLAKIILMIPNPAVGESAEDYVLAAEHHLNGLQNFTMLESLTCVGVRVHIDGKAPKVVQP